MKASDMLSDFGHCIVGYRRLCKVRNKWLPIYMIYLFNSYLSTSVRNSDSLLPSDKTKQNPIRLISAISDLVSLIAMGQSLKDFKSQMQIIKSVVMH